MRDGTKAGRALARVPEGLYLALLWVYVFYALSTHTTMKLPFPAGFDLALAPFLGAAALLRVIPFFREKEKRPWAALAACAMYLAAWLTLRYNFLLFLGILVLGSVGLSHRKLLGCALSAAGLCLLLAVGAACCGGINDLVYLDHGWLKSSLGINYPTDYASIVLFLVALLWVFWQELPEGVMLLPAGLSLWNAAVVARSQTSAYCTILLIALILYRMLEKSRLGRRPGFRRVQKAADVLLQAAFPVCGAAILALVWLYGQGNGFALRVDSWMTSRLSMAWNAFETYGIRPFGTAFKMYGNGDIAISRLNYNFVDISYALILVRYGWVTLLGAGALWVWTTRRAIRCGNRRLALCLALFAVHALSEHHFIEPEYNPLLFLPFASLALREPEDRKASARTACLRFAFAAAGCAGAALGAPVLFSWLRTIAALRGWRGTGAAVLPLLGLLLAAGLGLAALCAVLCRLTERAVRRLPVRRALAAFGAVLLLAGAGVWRLDRMADWMPPEYEPEIEANAPALELAVWAASGPVYVSDTPEWYLRRMDGLSRTPLDGGELVRFSPCTVLVPADTDSSVFLNTGFLYTPVSDTHALYTSDPGVISLLTQDGYHLTGYYPGVYTVDLKREARRNSLSRRGSRLLLDGPEQSLTQGPLVTLYGGRIVVAFSLEADPSAWEDGEEICEVKVTSSRGALTHARRTVVKEDFNKKGNCRVELAFNGWASLPNFEFLVIAREGKQLEVKKLTYRHLPLYDTHRTLGEDHLVAREEYYDLEGNPYWVNDSYTAVTYERDEAGDIRVYRYFGPDGEKVLANSGYWARRCDYNGNGKVVREELYDFDDRPMTLPQGYAACDFAYDGAGNVREYRYYDAEGRPVMIKNGYAILRRAYDGNRRTIREAYFDTEDLPVLRDWGYASFERSYDGAGNVTETIYYDTEGNRVEAP